MIRLDLSVEVVFKRSLGSPTTAAIHRGELEEQVTSQLRQVQQSMVQDGLAIEATSTQGLDQRGPAVD